MTKTEMNTLRQVQIELGGRSVQAWEPKELSMRSLGRWTDPDALLRRIHELQHPEETVADGPGRQWQATWRGRFAPNRGPRRRTAVA